MYWVHGNDTVGSPVREITVERERWKQLGDRLQVVVDDQMLSATRRVTSDTFVVDRDGRVASINGKPPGVHSRVDFLLHLPARPLEVGVRWADTLNSMSDGVGGQHRYRIQRAYQVAAELDTLGRHLERITATGTVGYRDGWWADSAAGTFYVIDVSGAVSESYLFDPRAGQLVTRSWKMDLRGNGIIPNDRGGRDTLPAGLLSEEKQSLLDPAAARIIGRALPQGDTSLTLDKGLLFVHTVRRGGDTIESGFGRNGGLVGTARVVFSKGSPTSYRATWTDGFGPVKTDVIQRRADSLAISHAGKDTMLAVPAVAWGIADYAMQELLVPAILALPADAAPHPFAIYRPHAAHWDSGAVVVRPIANANVVVLQMKADKQPQLLLITDTGDYLYGENSDPIGAQRVPTLGSRRRDQLNALLEKIKQR
jgi:hypothetical protein